MALSGRVAGGIDDALEQVLDRRLKEAIRQQQERQQADQMALAREQMAATAADRALNMAFRQSQQDRQDVGDILSDATPGPISEETAGVLRKTPQGQARMSGRRVIEGVRPIAGTAPLDESGPQQFSVLEPTKAQGEAQYRKGRLVDLTKILSGATTEQQRRSVGAQALGEGIEIPNNLLGQTGAEKTAQELADEHRQNVEWEHRNAITNDQANARQAASDRLMRERAGEARDEKPPTAAQSTLASYASRMEQAEPTLKTLEKHIVGMSLPSFTAQVWTDTPALQSKEIQQYMQASRNMINAVLRRESGAVISPTEFAEARKQYLPQPGDDPQTLEMKRANRALNAATYKKGAGKAYQSLDDAMKGPPLQNRETVTLPKPGAVNLIWDGSKFVKPGGD